MRKNKSSGFLYPEVYKFLRCEVVIWASRFCIYNTRFYKYSKMIQNYPIFVSKGHICGCFGNDLESFWSIYFRTYVLTPFRGESTEWMEGHDVAPQNTVWQFYSSDKEESIIRNLSFKGRTVSPFSKASLAHPIGWGNCLTNNRLYEKIKITKITCPAVS